MSAAIAVQDDFEADDLRGLAAKAKDADQARRLLALAAVCDGMDREEAARIGGMDRQTLRDWVHRFNERGPGARRADQHQAVWSPADAFERAGRGLAPAGGGRSRSGKRRGGALALRGLEARSWGAFRG